jgi:glycosyltransferase involved in cell wall biosynthesis
VVYAGRLEPRKNVLNLCRAFQRSEIATSHRLVLIGRMPRPCGSYSRRLKSHLDGPNIEWIGERDHADVLGHLAEAQIAALPSYFETTGLVALEAMFAGCQVVMTQMTYGSEYFDGFVHACDPHDVGSITRALERAVHCPVARPPSSYFERLSWRAIAHSLQQLYEDLL